MNKFAISENVLSTYKCFLCDHFLSVPPIHSAGLEKEFYRCGRCSSVKCQTYTRANLFEAVAQQLSFPCTYQPCNKKIAWGFVDQHEKNCPHRTMKCPMYYHNCSEKIKVEEIRNHFLERHSKNVREMGEPWRVNLDFDYVFLTEMDGRDFLVYILHLNDLFSISVLCTGRSAYAKFSVKLVKDNFSVSFEDMKVVRYDERSHCYPCMRKKCHEPCHPYSEKNKTSEMDVGGFTNKMRKGLIDSVKMENGDLT